MTSATTIDALLGEGDLALGLMAAVAAGLLIGIERGWRQREQADGTRVAGVRTFTLIGAGGGLVGAAAIAVSQAMAAVLLAGMVALVLAAFLRGGASAARRDATTMVVAMVALCLGVFAGAGYAAIALAGAALTTLVLAARKQVHGLVAALSREEVLAIARYAVIAIAILPFLPNADYGPYDAWNPFNLWLVVVLVTGFSIAGYIASRTIGETRGTIATALIGGAYSSTAVTAAFAARLKEDDTGPFSTGIALASAVMYVRVMVLAAVLAPRVLGPLTILLVPATVAALAVAALVWRRESVGGGSGPTMSTKPFELLPALGFLLAVAAASLLVRWAEAEFGEAGSALSLFIAGSFDVDAALVAYSTLPVEAVAVPLAALALAGTVAVNMAFKAGVVFVNAGRRKGKAAGLALVASLAVLLATIGWRAAVLFAWQ